jgi:ribosome-associated protein
MINSSNNKDRSLSLLTNSTHKVNNDRNFGLIDREAQSRRTANNGQAIDNLSFNLTEGGNLATRTKPSTPQNGAVTSRTLPTALHRACLAAKIAQENKGTDILVLDMRELTPMYDFFVIATGASKRQVHAIVEDVDEQYRKLGDMRMGLEGYEASKWVVQDYGDVVLHVFDPDTRAYYQLEELWNDAPRIEWQDELVEA